MLNITSKIKYLSSKKLTFFLMLFLILGMASAQNELVTTTLEKSNELIELKKFNQAAQLLGSFEQKYPGNIWIERLYAQTLFWIDDFQKASEIYERAMGYHPDNMDVKYEYALMLFHYNKYGKAKLLLLEYEKEYPNNVDVQVLLGKIYYYQNHFKEAEKHLGNAKNIQPNDESILNLYNEINRIIAPQLLIGGGFRFDEQPLNAIGPRINFSKYNSDFIDFGISGDMINYSNIPNTNLISSLSLSNKFNFKKVGLKVSLSAGGIYSKLASETNWIGEINITKKFGKLIKVEMQAARKNYDYTVRSVGSLLIISEYIMKASVGSQNTWNSTLGIQSNFFPDNNYVNSYYLWLLSKPIKLSKLKFRFGYAFNYSNSKTDKFEALKSRDYLINNSTEKIEGIYSPYYTPKNQITNSILTNIDYNIGKRISLHGHASVGVYSIIDAPYLYLDNDNNLIIVRDYSNQNYIPLNMGISMQSMLSNTVDLNISYSYMSTYYFVTNNINVGLKMYF